MPDLLPTDPQTRLLFIASHNDNFLGLATGKPTRTLGDFVNFKEATPNLSDVAAVLTINRQQITVSFNEGTVARKFISEPKYSFYTLQIPNTKEPLKGTLFRRTDREPSGKNGFWIQQYPSYFGEDGRIVVEFWNEGEIVGVFKTPGGNFGALGEGTWDILRQ